MKKRLIHFTNLCLLLPVIVFLIIGTLFSDNLHGLLLLGFWNLKIVNFASSGVVNTKMKAEEVILIESFDRVDKSSNDPSIKVTYQITSPEFITGTATIPPVPTYTLQFPKVTETSQLLQANRYPEESEITKKESVPFWLSIRRFWPFVLLIVIWLVIGIWYIFSQLIIE